MVFLPLILLCFAGTGCAVDQTNRANKLIGDFNVHIAEHNKLDKETSELIRSVNNKAETKDEFKKNVIILDQAKTKINQQREELTKALNSLVEAKGLKISKEFKTYIEMEQGANEANEELFRMTAEVVNELKTMYEALGSESGLSKKEVDERTNKIIELNDKVSKQEKKAKELKRKAKEYYNKHDLGK